MDPGLLILIVVGVVACVAIGAWSYTRRAQVDPVGRWLRSYQLRPVGDEMYVGTIRGFPVELKSQMEQSSNRAPVKYRVQIRLQLVNPVDARPLDADAVARVAAQNRSFTATLVGPGTLEVVATFPADEPAHGHQEALTLALLNAGLIVTELTGIKMPAPRSASLPSGKNRQ